MFIHIKVPALPVENNAKFQDCNTNDLGGRRVLEAMILVFGGLDIGGRFLGGKCWIKFSFRSMRGV
jgi:hypothetical protein